MAGAAKPSDTSRAEHASGLGRWLTCALLLHAGPLLLVGASGLGSPPRSSLPARPPESDLDVSLDVVERAPQELVRSTTPDMTVLERTMKPRTREAGALPSSATTRGRDPPSNVPRRGLRTISNGTGEWPQHIPHHLGRITGSRHGGVAVWGALSEPSLRRTVTEHSPAIRRCYDEGLSSVPNLAGRAIMRLVIQRDGQVQRVNTLGSDLASKTVLRCLESVFESIRFPRADSDTVTVTYPLPLSPVQPPDWGVVP